MKKPNARAGFYRSVVNALFLILCTVGLSFTAGAQMITTFDAPAATRGTFALGINPAGRLTGYYCDDTTCHGFVRNARGGITTFEVSGDANSTYPYSINPAGAITGHWTDAGGLSHSADRSERTGGGHNQEPVVIHFTTVAVGASDAIIIPCHVLGNHSAAWTICLLDTGASTTIVDKTFARGKHKPEVFSVSADGTKTKVHQERLTITLPVVGAADLQYSARVCVMGLRPAVLGVGVILGEDFLHQYKSVHIDYIRHLLILSQSP